MAGFLSYGSGKALAYKHDFQKDVDRLYQREAYRAQIEAQKEEKSRFYASMMKEQTAAAPVNQKKLTEYYSGLSKEVAEYAMNHPKWESDVMESQQMFSIMDKYINNDIIREDQQVQQAWETAKQAFAQGNMTQSEYEENAERYNKYASGESQDPYVFVNPKKKSVADFMQEITKTYSPEESALRESGSLFRVSAYTDNQVALIRESYMKDPEFVRTMTKDYNDIPAEMRIDKTIEGYIDNVIRQAGQKKELAGDDSFATYQYKQMLEQQAAGSVYLPSNDLNRTLSQYGNVAPNPANIAFTPGGDFGKKIYTGPHGSVFTVENPLAKSGGSQYTDITLAGDVEQVGVGEVINIGNVSYVKTQVKVTLSKDLEVPGTEQIEEKGLTETEKLSRQEKKRKEASTVKTKKQLMSEELISKGFVPEKESKGFGSASFGEMNQTPNEYIGWILTPANFDANARMNYDMNIFGTKESTAKAFAAGAYNDMRFQFDRVSSGLEPDTRLITSSTAYDIQNVIGRPIERDEIKWTANKDDRFIYETEIDGQPFRFNFKTLELETLRSKK